LRLIFAGTPEFASVALRRLGDAGHTISLVLTQPDRPAGRGMKLQASPVKQFSLEHGLPVCQPRGLRLDGRFADDALTARAAIGAADADAMVVAAYGLILPQWVLDAMRERANGARLGLGCLNIHASLLPRWRGAAPIHRAIEAGDARTGVCIMQMDAGLDTGDILLQSDLPIIHQGPHADTTGSLHDKLAVLGADLVVRALDLAARGQLAAYAQAAVGVSYADKVDKSQARVDWSRSAEQIARSVRAFDPAPGAWTSCAGETLKIWRALADPAGETHGQAPGCVLSADGSGIVVACGTGTLLLQTVQRAGGKRLAVADFLRGQSVGVGMRLGDDK
jgi:methionyl-tRNA formyltransferase